MLVLLLGMAMLQSHAQQASSLLNAGVELAHQGRFNEAGDKIVQALALDPNLAEAHYLLGLVRHQDGRTEVALQSFRAALKINPRYADAQVRVCELETVFARANETGYDRALASCRRAIQLDPRDPEPHFHSGWIQAKLGNFAASISEYNTVLKLDPKFARVRFELAMTYLDSQDASRAIPLLREVIAAEPGNTNARFQLGSALSKQGDCAAAVDQLQAATESAQKYYLLAMCWKKLNRPEQSSAALASVKEFRQHADARMQAKYLAAVAHQKAAAGEMEEAIAGYRAALDLVGDPTIAIDLAVALLKNGQPEEVVRLLGADTNPLARYQVALADSKLGRFAEAQFALETALRDKPDFTEAWYQLGVNLLSLDKSADAEHALRTAARLRPDEPAIRVAWAEALERAGNTEEAKRQRQLAAKLPKIVSPKR
jgi:tetratricopeptide (TPR) repeat protein